MSDSRIIGAVILIAIALIFFFLEVFVPSGGLLALLAAVALIVGVVMLFYVNTTLGLIGLVLSLVAIPFLVAFGMKIMPNTPIGRLLTLKNPPPADDPAEAAASRKDLVGATGKALTDLRPIGTCLINGERTECMAERGVIEAGQPVRIVLADGMQIKVRVDEQV